MRALHSPWLRSPRPTPCSTGPSKFVLTYTKFKSIVSTTWSALLSRIVVRQSQFWSPSRYLKFSSVFAICRPIHQLITTLLFLSQNYPHSVSWYRSNILLFASSFSEYQSVRIQHHDWLPQSSNRWLICHNQHHVAYGPVSPAMPPSLRFQCTHYDSFHLVQLSQFMRATTRPALIIHLWQRQPAPCQHWTTLLIKVHYRFQDVLANTLPAFCWDEWWLNYAIQSHWHSCESAARKTWLVCPSIVIQSVVPPMHFLVCWSLIHTIQYPDHVEQLHFPSSLRRARIIKSQYVNFAVQFCKQAVIDSQQHMSHCWLKSALRLPTRPYSEYQFHVTLHQLLCSSAKSPSSHQPAVR